MKFTPQVKAAARALSRVGKATGGPVGSILGTPVGVAPTASYAAGGVAEERPHSVITEGSILSDVPGRTDSHATHVPSGAYVIPADIVSGRGQGNTLAGAKALEKLFKIGKTPRRAFGGPAEAKTPVRVNLAGGEVVVPPENLTEVVHPDLKTAHEIMDAWVLEERKKLRKELEKLPGPARD